MSVCVFCDIVANDAPAYRIFEDEQTLAFLDIEPANPGHVLVIPTTHCETLTDMSSALTTSVFQTVRRVADAIESAFDPDGVNIMQSNGAAAGQEIHHAHVHVVPRYDGDDVTLHWTASAPSGQSLRDLTSVLREVL